MRTYTSAEAAAKAGYTPTGFGAAMSKLRQQGPDFDYRINGATRPPIWEADKIDEWVSGLQRRQRKTPPMKLAPPRPDAFPVTRESLWAQRCLMPRCKGHQTLEAALEHAALLDVIAHEVRLSAALALVRILRDEDGAEQLSRIRNETDLLRIKAGDSDRTTELRRVSSQTHLPLAEVKHLYENDVAPLPDLAESLAYYGKHPRRTPGVAYPDEQ